MWYDTYIINYHKHKLMVKPANENVTTVLSLFFLFYDMKVHRYNLKLHFRDGLIQYQNQVLMNCNIC